MKGKKWQIYQLTNSRFPLTSHSNKYYLDGSIFGWWVVCLFGCLYAENLQVSPDLPVQQNFPRPDQTRPDQTRPDQTRNFSDFFWTFCLLLPEVLRTFPGLSRDFPRTFPELSQYFLVPFLELFFYFPMAFLVLSQDLLKTFLWYSQDFLRTFSVLFNYFPGTYSSLC